MSSSSDAGRSSPSRSPIFAQPTSPTSPSPLRTKFGFGGVPYKPSMSIDSLLSDKTVASSSSSGSSVDVNNNQSSDVVYSPSIYSPQSPQIPFSPMGWDEAPTPPSPLRINKKSLDEVGGHLKPKFDPESVPKPSDYELEKPYGGSKHFMMSHGLKYYDQADCDLRKQILDQIRELEWQNRVNAAREEYYRDVAKAERDASPGSGSE